LPATTTSVDTKPPAIATLAEEAQRRLRERPSLSIRRRLGIGLCVWIALSLGLAAASLVMLQRIEGKLHVMEAASSYTFEIQQARRFEKNFFLYRTNLDDALEHVHRARQLLDAEREDLVAVISAGDLDAMESHLARYETLLGQLRPLENSGETAAQLGADLEAVEARLREHGAVMVSEAEDVLARERSEVTSLLTFSQRVPIAFLALLVLLIAYLVWFISQQMLAPLGRMMSIARRVADGDFTMVMPHRKYRDEFSELAIALNHMMHQVLQRQDLLVKAHKLKAVGTLTAGVAHELNNPINNIMLSAGTLEEDYRDFTDEERLDVIRDLVSESERAQRIVRNLLDFARESEAEVDALDACEIVDETLRLAANQIKLSGTKVERECQEHLPPLHGDRQQLQQVFLNMVLNALEAMPGGGTLTISLGPDKSRERVSIRFQDTGVGIPEQHLEDIFDPFYSSRASGEGTGLGLSVSLGIIRQHGGHIHVRSKVGVGTTFEVLLPVARVPADLSTEIE